MPGPWSPRAVTGTRRASRHRSPSPRTRWIQGHGAAADPHRRGPRSHGARGRDPRAGAGSGHHPRVPRPSRPGRTSARGDGRRRPPGTGGSRRAPTPAPPSRRLAPSAWRWCGSAAASGIRRSPRGAGRRRSCLRSPTGSRCGARRSRRTRRWPSRRRATRARRGRREWADDLVARARERAGNLAGALEVFLRRGEPLDAARVEASLGRWTPARRLADSLLLTDATQPVALLAANLLVERFGRLTSAELVGRCPGVPRAWGPRRRRAVRPTGGRPSRYQPGAADRAGDGPGGPTSIPGRAR